jgi:hypothetical protein
VIGRRVSKRYQREVTSSEGFGTPQNMWQKRDRCYGFDTRGDDYSLVWMYKS